MGDSENNAFSLTALVISLIALVVALGQLLQQYLGTAEGYRRCAPSVVGPWAKFRRRHWIWSEFRFETAYVAPHIVCVTPDELEDLRRSAEHERAYRVCSRSLAYDYASQVLNKTVHKSPHARAEGATDDHPRSKPISLDLERSGSAGMNSHSTEQKRYAFPEGDRSLSPSWIELMKEIHDAYVAYWPADCLEGCRLNRRIPLDVPPSESKSLSTSPSRSYGSLKIASTAENLDRTDAAIQYRTWTWDFMPPDLTKPLATSTVSDVILFGLRLGMDWRTIDPGNGRMAADGRGASFQVFEIRGLGMVLKFTAPGGSQPQEPLQVIPSRAVDKILFGIIPGDPDLVQQDVPTVKDNRKSAKSPPLPTFEAIGMPLHTRTKFREDKMKCGTEINNETFALLCPFLPIKGCPENRAPKDLFENNRKGAFHFWEGRYGLFKALESKDRVNSDAMQYVFNTLVWLESRYEADFYSRWGETALETVARGKDNVAQATWKKEGVGTPPNIIEECRDAFDKTTKWFIDHGFQKRTSYADGPRTLYVSLVAAHANLAGNVLTDWHKRLDQIRDEKIDISQEAWQNRYNLPRNKYRFFVFECYEIAQRYVENLHLVGKYMQEQGAMRGHSESEFEEAWWVMMLRGILWDIALFGEEGEARQPVPSSMFDNKTPVWII